MKYWKRLSTTVDNTYTVVSASGYQTGLSRTLSSSSVAVYNDKNTHRIVTTRTVYKVTKGGKLKRLLGQTIMAISDGPTAWPEYTHRKEVRWQAILRKYKHKNSLLIHNANTFVETIITPEDQVPSALVNQCHAILNTTKVK